MLKGREPVTWSQFRRYQGDVMREAGWLPWRPWVAALLAGVSTGGAGKAMTGDWSVLAPALIGIAVGLLFYGLDMALASVRINRRLGGGTDPIVDRRLKIVEERPGYIPGGDYPEHALQKAVREGLGSPKPIFPEYSLFLRVLVLKQVHGYGLLLRLSGPVLKSSAELHKSSGGTLAILVNHVQNKIHVFPAGAIPAGSIVGCYLYSTEPLRLTEAALVRE